MQLYGYFRSSASYRVRIALNLKGEDYEQIPVHLVQGDQRSDAYLEKNPQGLVPALEDGGVLLTQSLAIIEYLDEKYPEPALLPSGLADRARVRAMSQIVACEMQPLNNLRVLGYLKNELAQDAAAVSAWYAHWIAKGFDAYERQVATYGSAGGYSFGDTITMADIALVPQMYNARRMDCDVSAYPLICAVVDRLNTHPAFDAARPENQPDAV